MRYRIDGTMMQTLTVVLEADETVYSESGAMAWMSANVEMKSEMKGGLGGAIGRMLTGESLFITNFTARNGRGTITFASDFPGKIIPLHLKEGESMICQKDAFFVAEKSVTLKTCFTKKFGAGLVGGDGFILQEITGPGVAFVALDGEITEMTLKQGDCIKVDTGCVGMLEPSVVYDVEMVKGVANMLFGGEGLFLASLEGPGKAWLQSMPVTNLAGAVSRFIPRG